MAVGALLAFLFIPGRDYGNLLFGGMLITLAVAFTLMRRAARRHTAERLAELRRQRPPRESGGGAPPKT